MRKLDDWIDAYITFTHNSEPPESYKKWLAISVIAGVLQRKCYLEWGSSNFYPNMYIVLVGPSGRCRKGTAMSVGHKMLRDIGIPMAAEATTRESLIQALEEAGEANGGFSIAPDGEIFEHNSLTIFSPELTVFLGYNNLPLISDLTDWYDCREPWEYRTKNSGVNVIQATYVNLLGATTPDLIRTAIPQDAVGGGLVGRMIFIVEWQKSRTIAYPFLTKSDMELYEKLKHDLEEIYTMRGAYKVTDGFLRVWKEWYETNDANPPFRDNPQMEGYVNRRGNHIMKLSMIMSASKSSDMKLDEESIRKAIKTLEEVENRMASIFVGFGTAQNSDITMRFLDVVRSAGAKGIHPSLLQKTLIGYFSTIGEYNEIQYKLIKSGSIAVDSDSKLIYSKEIWDAIQKGKKM